LNRYTKKTSASFIDDWINEITTATAQELVKIPRDHSDVDSPDDWPEGLDAIWTVNISGQATTWSCIKGYKKNVDQENQFGPKFSKNDTLCTKCEQGTYQPVNDSAVTVCENKPTCPDGEYDQYPDDTTKSPSCTQNEWTCDNGKSATGNDCTVNEAEKCTSCNDGYYLDPDNKTCVEYPACPTGQIFDIINKVCRDCDAGYSNYDEETTLTYRYGYSSDPINRRENICYKCKAGYVTNRSNQSNQSNHIINNNNNEGGCLRCKMGYESVRNQCKACERGKSSFDPNTNPTFSDTCKPCKTGYDADPYDGENQGCRRM